MSLNGKINLNVVGPTYFGTVNPFINQWKVGRNIELFMSDNSTWSTGVGPGEPNSPWDFYLDANGDLRNPLPTSPLSVVSMSRIFQTDPSAGIPLPAGYAAARYGEAWVATWDGSASSVVVGGAASQTPSSNRIDFTYPSVDNATMKITFAGIDVNNPPRNIKVFQAKNETALNSGQQIKPDYITQIQRASGILRFLVGVNDNTICTTADLVADQAHAFWGDTYLTQQAGGLKGGYPLALQVWLANQVKSHPWICIPHAMGTPKVAGKVSAVTLANPAVVTVAGHPFVNGDSVLAYLIYGTGAQSLNQNIYSAGGVVSKTSLQLTGSNTSSDPAFVTTGGSGSEMWLSSPYSLTGMATEIGKIAAVARDSVLSPLITYFEYSNEVWNNGFRQYYWVRAQAVAVFGSADVAKMYGYLAAHAMKVVRDTYGTSNRRRWRGVLSAKTIDSSFLANAVTGALYYISTQAPTLTIRDLFDDFAVTGYYGGVFKSANLSLVQQWMADSQTRFTNGLEPDKYAYFNRAANAFKAQYLTTLQTLWAAHKSIADTYGMTLVQYEGGDSNQPQNEFVTDPTFQEFYPYQTHTAENAAIFTQSYQLFEAYGRYPSKFVEGGAVNIYGDFGGFRYIGDSNPVWDAVINYNDTKYIRRRFKFVP